MFAVKYMREVMPYFRSSSLGLAELSWAGVDVLGNSGGAQGPQTPPWVADTKDTLTLRLPLAHVCSNLNMPDLQVCLFISK